MSNGESWFQPREGALLDLESLHAIADAPSRLLDAWCAGVAPGSPGLVLEGFELQGEWTGTGPPGTRRPEGAGAPAVISPGRAIASRPDGRRVLVQLDESVAVAWPNSAGPAVRGSLVLLVRTEPGSTPGGLAVATDRVSVQLGFVRPEAEDGIGVLPLATALGNGRDWAIDLHRVWQPEHPAVRLLVKRLEGVEQTVWKAEPEGSVWDRQVLGRNWVRYQTMAASAVQAARNTLDVHALATIERVRVLAGLRRQLAASVERAATELLQVVGANESVGPYRVLVDGGA